MKEENQRASKNKVILNLSRRKRYVANWRPISLLNVDFKIASKTITSKLEKLLSDLITADQNADVEENIFDAVRTIGNIMDYSELYNLPGLMVTTDFEKAFNSLSWNFRFKTLEKFNFSGESFISGYVFFILIY